MGCAGGGGGRASIDFVAESSSYSWGLSLVGDFVCCWVAVAVCNVILSLFDLFSSAELFLACDPLGG